MGGGTNWLDYPSMVLSPYHMIHQIFDRYDTYEY